MSILVGWDCNNYENQILGISRGRRLSCCLPALHTRREVSQNMDLSTHLSFPSNLLLGVDLCFLLPSKSSCWHFQYLRTWPCLKKRFFQRQPSLKWGHWGGCNPSCDLCPYKKEKFGHRRKAVCRYRENTTWICRQTSLSQGDRPGEILPSPPLEGTRLDFRLLTSRIVRKYISVV